MSTSAGLTAGNKLANSHAVRKLSEREITDGIFDPDQSWHKQYKGSSYIFIGGLKTAHPDKEGDVGLSEGDIVAVFSQWGDIYDVHLVRDHESGRSRGFAFLGYEDARSCALAVDNANGMRLCDRVLTIDHMKEFRAPRPRKPPEEDGAGLAGPSLGLNNYNDIEYWRKGGAAGKSTSAGEINEAAQDVMGSLSFLTEEEQKNYVPSGPEGHGPEVYCVLESVRNRYRAHKAAVMKRDTSKKQELTSKDRGLNQLILDPKKGTEEYDNERRLIRDRHDSRSRRSDGHGREDDRRARRDDYSSRDRDYPRRRDGTDRRDRRDGGDDGTRGSRRSPQDRVSTTRSRETPTHSNRHRSDVERYDGYRDRGSRRGRDRQEGGGFVRAMTESNRCSRQRYDERKSER